MYIPHPDTLSTRTTLLSDLHGPLAKSDVSLNTSGMASFFGGNVAVAAMTTLHLNPTRRWLGWYNSPGTYEVARHYSKFCDSRLLEGLFPGAPTDLATLLVMDNMKGGYGVISAHLEPRRVFPCYREKKILSCARLD
ncbi:hypothetical protein SCLCIDRAFT_330773 [Scleroderma citrinum Foug A]|uniref:Uncharacterized protein n=1 Tax=Scleroderma citrinum Foug A TaxID=1036808 RepID=A0A0C3DFV6_9AGAM|nr:hypothetical protein SCLCIDRAFT_330773 [Scleroderma citrinum Foug A]